MKLNRYHYLIFWLLTVIAAGAVGATRADERASVRSWSTSLDNSELPKGELFQARSGTIACGAGYVYAIQSRIFTNSNDLEFWCRKPGMELRFERLTRSTDSLTTNIAHVDGMLYDFQSAQVYDFSAQRWRPAPLGGVPKPYLVQGKPDGLYVISTEQPNCPGLSVYANGTYLGTVRAESYSAAAVWEGRLVVNSGALIAAKLRGPAGRSCTYLPTRVLSAEKMWAYGIYLTRPNTLLIGGDLPGYGARRKDCVPHLLEVTASGSRRIPVSLGTTHCNPGTIKEYYTFAPWQDGVLIGNFPLGTLLHFDGHRAEATAIAAPGPDDWFDPKGTYYRETQGLVNAYGATFVGVYPWAEVVSYDHLNRRQTSVRLMQKPQKQATTPTPYFWSIHDRVRKMPGVQFLRDAELAYSLMKDGRSLREEGLEPTRWGQRVASVAVLSGRLCASTGSLAGDAYRPELHPEMPRDVLEGYGRVSCASLPNHVLVPRAQGKKAVFRVTTESLEIEIDGKLAASVRHRLSPAELSQLAGDQ